MGRLSGKVAIITGASQGMGEAHARAFVKEGAKVVLTDVQADLGQKLADDLGENAIFAPHNVARLAEWQAVVAQGEERFGPITVLVNNAAVIGKVASVSEMSEEDYRSIVDVNEIGVFLGMKCVLPSMMKAGVGSIVNISSIAGMAAVYGAPNIAYVGTKFAVRGMTKQVAIDYGRHNIRCNSIHPGFIKTPMMAAATDENGGEAVGMIPLGRLAEPREVSNLALFLASDESSFVTGMEHVIDGGMTAS